MKRLLLLLALILPSLAQAQDSAVIFNEIQYHPANELTETEWIELKSLSGVDIDLSGWSITGGVNYTFPEGTILVGRAFMLVAATPSQLPGSLGPWTGTLSNSSETLRIRNRNGRIMDAITYSDSGDWPTGADGSGATLARRNQLSAGDGPLAWAASNELGGTPGGSNFADAETAPRSTKVVPISATWKYNDSGVAPPANWKDASFADGAWNSGAAIFAAGTGKMAEPAAPTVILGNAGVGLLGYWAFAETSGTNAANSAAGGTAGTLVGSNVAFVADGTRGQVLRVNISAANVNTPGSYVTAGTLPAFNLTNSFTWAVWVKTTNAANSSVMLGNRYSSTGADFVPREFIKFTNTTFEWHRNGTGENLDYADLSGTNAAPSAWIHMVIVKNGATLTHYRNGVAAGSSSMTATPVNAQPFYMGGDKTNESWSGYLDDVAIWNRALPSQAITGLAAGTYNPATAPTTATPTTTVGLIPADIQFPMVTTTELTDDFNAATLDTGKWTVENIGLESTVDGGYNAPSTTGGNLTLSGASTFSYWAGKSIKTITRFNTRSQITAKIDRVSLSVTGTLAGPVARSSVWLYADASHYVHFSHNLNEGGWSYNSRDDGGTGTNGPTGSGVNLNLLDSFDLDTGNCEMKLVWVPGAYVGQGTVQMYRNGLLSGSQAVTNWPADFAVMVTGQSRQTGDNVTAVFDNFSVQKSTPQKVQTTVAMNAGAHYFRTAFNYTGDPARTTLSLYPLVDDGAVFYLNGQEIYRQNMPGGTVTHSTLASSEVLDGYFPTNAISVPVTNLLSGNNVLAVEVHQNIASSPDMLFGAQLQAVESPAVPADQAPTLVINEITSTLTTPFQVELKNLSGTALDLTRYTLRDSLGHSLALTGTLAANGLTVITETMLGYHPANNDRLYLVQNGRNLVDAHTVHNTARARNDSGYWGIPASGSIGTANASWSLNTDVVINEIFYSAPGTSNEQWVELYNKGTGSVSLDGWQFSDGISYTFPAGTSLGAGQYALVVWDVTAFNALHPGLPRVLGPITGSISGQGERIRLVDAVGNLADEVSFSTDGRWPAFAGGTGSSLELKNPRADNNVPEAWADSNETSKGVWTNVSYTFSGATLENDPTFYSEFVMGLINDGEVLIDDISVVEDPTGTNLQLIQNGNFSAGTTDKWRNIGNHKTSVVVDDPTSPGNKVLKIIATGYTEHMSNHCETSLKNGTTLPWPLKPASTYRISYRARWVRGCNQLHTRLFFNVGAHSELLPMATTGGTPGAQNSVYVANAGPTFSGLTHFPAVPAVSQPANVSVTLADPDNVASANIFYSVDGAAFATAAITAGLNGLWTGTIPGQAASAKVQFYIVATDALGASSTFPAAGTASRAMIPWNDSQALLTLPSGCKPHNFRIVMTTADASALHALNDIMSNEYRPCTVIYDEREIYYHCKVHLKSSEHGRAKQPRVGFMVQFAPDELFLGTHDTIAIDRSGAGDQFSQKEIIVKHTLNRANGIPCTQDDLIRVIAPQNIHTGSAILVKTKLDSTSFLDGQFDGGSKGTLFEYELICGLYGASITSGSTTDNTYEGLKLTQDGDVRGVPIRKLNPGLSKEEYRQHFLIKNNRGADDYSLLMPMLDALGQPSGATFTTNTNNLLDVNQWLRSFAGQIAWGVGDNYTSGAQHNALFYTRPGYKAMYFPWDMDFTAANGATTSIVSNGELSKLIVDPVNKRLYYGHLLSICDNAFNTGHLNRWMTHYSCFLSEDLTSFTSYVSQREAYIRAQVAAAIPSVSFAITTNGGNNYTETNPATTLAGNGWVNVDRIRLAGSVEPLVVTWTSQSTWQVLLPVTFGPNVFNFEALDTTGNVIGTDSITVTGTSPLVPADDTNLALVEINYNPGGTNPGREFVELRNVSTNTLLLTGLRFVDGIQFNFPAGMQLAPGARILVVDDATLFAARYGSGLPIAGSFAPSGLGNGGELLTLLDANGNPIFSYSYTDNIKSTDGNGRSLTRVLSATAPILTEYLWRASCVDGGTPGTTDAVAFIGSPLADNDHDGYTALTEYAFGTSDTDPNSHPAVTVFSTIPGQFTLTVDTAACADDVKILPQYSTDLTTWQTLDGFPTEIPLTGTEISGSKLRNTLGPVLYPATADNRFYFRFQVVPR